MLVAFLIMLREGVEAALIVGIVASYLKQTGRGRLLPAVWIGVVMAALLCLALGLALKAASAEFPQRVQEMFEGAVALFAVVLLGSMVFWMKKAARSIKGELQRSVDTAVGAGEGGGLALAGLAFFAVGREGLESVFFLLAIAEQAQGYEMPVGAALGIAAAVGVGFAIYGFGVRIDLRRFFRWTGVFILFVAAGLVAGALRAFHEAGLWNGLQTTAFDASAWLPQDSVLGTLLEGLFGYQAAPTLGEVAVYLAFLIPSLLLFLAPTQSQPAPRHA